MKEMRRVLALVLCFVMLVGLVPVSALAAEAETIAPSETVAATEVTDAAQESTAAAETEAAVIAEPFNISWVSSEAVTGNVVYDAAVFCSDVHGSASDLASVFGGLDLNVSVAGFVGDTCLTTESVNSTVNNALGYTPDIVYSYASSHDTENGSDIGTNWNYSGEAYDGNFYVYTIREDDMKTASAAATAAANFTTWASTADTSKPLFIMTHRPMHERREGCEGGNEWYKAIQPVAEKMDVVVFWGHNHTGENDVDIAAYYVAKDGTEEMTITNGATVIPNFTYMNAGYINANGQNPARKGIATTVQISDDSLIFQDYNASGAYTGTYAHNVTVAREFAAAEEETTPTVNTVECSGTYVEDGETVENSDYLTAKGLGLTGMTAVWNDTDVSEVLNPDYYSAYDVTLEGYTEGDVTVTLDMNGVDTADGMKLYFIAEDGTLTEVTDFTYADTETGMTVTFTVAAASFSVAAGNPAADAGIPADAALTRLEIAGPTKTKYFLDTEVINGNVYLDIEGLEVTAIYTYEGVEYPKALDWNQFNANVDGYGLTMDDLTTAGKKTVTVTYGDAEPVTFTVWVCEKQITTESGITVTFDAESVVSMTVAAVEADETVNIAVADKLSGTVVAYDIAPVYANNETALTGTATVTLPIPEGVTNPAVYYVSDDGATVTKMSTTVNEDGTVTFVTDHFSKYVVGENTEITMPEPGTATGSGTTTTSEEKQVYVLVSSISAAGDYLIVNTNSATTSAHLLTATSSGVTDTSGVTITTGTNAAGTTVTYIESPAAAAIWTASGSNNSYKLYNSAIGRYLQRSSSNLTSTTSSSSASNWNTSKDNAIYYDGGTDRYIRYSSGWGSLQSGSGTVYIYQKQTVSFSTTTTVSGTYSIAGEDITKVVVNGTTATLSSTLTFTPTSGNATTTDTSATATYTVVEGGDPNGVISGISGNTVTFTGNYGKALVKVSYTTGFGVVTNYITVTASEPTYSIEITDAAYTVVTITKFEDGVTYYTQNTDGTYSMAESYVAGTTYYTRGAGEVIEKTIVVKGAEVGDSYDLWADVTYITANGVDESYVVDADALRWASNNEDVAIVDVDGFVSFQGVDGTVQITVYYEYADGKEVTDVVTFSVSANQYTIPEDGTDDFPEYPNQGAIRIDKTAEAVGNFSETGLAKVELSMTGVPYGANTKTDVVIMVDMTASMSDDDVTAAEAAVKELIESLVYDEENDKYDSNIQLFVDVFYSASSDSSFSTEEYLNNVTISSASELTAAQAKIDFTQSSKGGGTRYNLAMKDVYETLNRDGHADNQFVVFVSDGVPTAYAPLTDGALGTTITGSNSTTASLAAGWFDDAGEVTDKFETEYYSYLIKTAGIPVYTVGCNLTALSDPADVLNHMSSNYSADGKTATGETKYSFFCTTSGGITDDVLNIFHNIGVSIKEAATNVVVEDKIGDDYTVSFSLPGDVTAEKAGMEDFYIQVVSYTLDATTNERTNADSPSVLEKFLFSADGTITHTIGSATCGSTCTHVTYTDGVVTAIDGTYFDYKVDAKGDEYLTWTADKLDRSELALQYFAYLDNSAGLTQDEVNAGKEKAPGTYYTNEYATITYTNFNGKECQQYFPEPSMTWNGAKVTYLFYLVNDAGQPVNRAGKVVPFAEAVYVTTPVTYDVTWNETTGTENMLAKDLAASSSVPTVYKLYDENAYYEIRVYQNEGVDQGNAVKNYNYFVIDGSDSGLTSYETTKVFNTKAGIKYDDYGVYSAQAKNSVLYTSSTDENGNKVESTVTVDYQTTDIDYANTTVAFAVVWKPELVEDTVVVDYGLDVVIDVYINDALAAGVSGVSLTAPADIEINKGTYADSKKVGAASITSADEVWTASVENLKEIRFHQNNMQFASPAEFYYEAGVNYYTYDEDDNATLNTTNMYSKVTVIPATTVYYEDTFLTLSDNWEEVEDETLTNAELAALKNATQAVDRPGHEEIQPSYDANNVYGYDSAYDNCSTYSLGSAQMVTVSGSDYATAEFDFYGTGFDVISLTSNTSGTLTVEVTDENNAVVKFLIVDTYYGYQYVQKYNTYNKTDKGWVLTDSKDVAESGVTYLEKLPDPADYDTNVSVRVAEKEWTVTEGYENALYQIPVIKVSDLKYAKYHVTITAAYNKVFDHAGTGSYEVYLDAIRIYDPTGVASGQKENATVSDAYLADDEAKPEYFELRNMLISAESFNKAGDGNISGAIFIDHVGGTYTITDYENYGPNNELYLAKGQAVTFVLNVPANMADVQIGMKSADGSSVAVKMSKYGTNANGTANVSSSTAVLGGTDGDTIGTATDRYYSIGNHLSAGNNWLSFQNVGSSGIVSITNIKVTKKDSSDTGATDLNISQNEVNTVLMLLNSEEEPEEPVVTLDADLDVNIRNKSVKAGSNITVMATTSADVDYLMVNGQKVTKYTENKSTGKRSWSVNVRAAEAGDMEIVVTAYSADGDALETVTETVEVTAKNGGAVQQIIGQLIGMLGR